MSNLKGGGKPNSAGINSNPWAKGKKVSKVSTSKVEQLSESVAEVKLNSTNDGDWEVFARKSKNRAGSSAAKPWNNQNSNSKASGHTDAVSKPAAWNDSGHGRPSGKTLQSMPSDHGKPTGGNARTKGSDNNTMHPQSVIRPPLENGWNWQSRIGPTPVKDSEYDNRQYENISQSYPNEDDEDQSDHAEKEDNDSDILDDSDDDLLIGDSDSDSSEKSHETRKKSKWFNKFFELLNGLTVEEINEPNRQWHCPACQGGSGAIDWYRGLQPLITHAKTKGSKRVKIHRDLAALLDEELLRRGASNNLAGEAFGKWKGLLEEDKDHDIVWPPMVIIMNTKLERDDNDKWRGMGNQELLDYFSTYAASKARHSYGPQGHRGMSILIFEATAGGYLEAERLDKHFSEQGTHRDAWDRRRHYQFIPGGNRQLYGYMAVKEDLDIFNHHCQGKSKLKYDIRSYQEMVVKQIRQMSEDNQQLIWLKNKVDKVQKKAKVYQESLGVVCEKLRKTKEENRIVRERTQMQHEENKEEMNLQEEFFKEQMEVLHKSRDAKEENFERLQQEEREKVKQLNATPCNAEEYKRRAEETAKFIKLQDEEMDDFVRARDELVKGHEEKMAEMKRRHWEEEVELEKEFDRELTQLMDKHTPHHPGDSSKDLDG